MTRYMIYFKNGDVKRVSQENGEKAIRAKMDDNSNVVINGALYDSVMFERIVPMTREHFSKDEVETQQRSELASPDERAYLEKTGNLPKLLNE